MANSCCDGTYCHDDTWTCTANETSCRAEFETCGIEAGRCCDGLTCNAESGVCGADAPFCAAEGEGCGEINLAVESISDGCCSGLMCGDGGVCVAIPATPVVEIPSGTVPDPEPYLPVQLPNTGTNPEDSCPNPIIGLGIAAGAGALLAARRLRADRPNVSE